MKKKLSEFPLSISKRRHALKVKRKWKRKKARLDRFSRRVSRSLAQKDKTSAHLICPKIFNITKNPEEVIGFYNKLIEAVLDGRRINYDMQDIEELSIDSVLYLLAITRRMKRLGVPYNLTGSTPRKASCKDLLRTSGFFNFMNSTTEMVEKSGLCVEIESGDFADPEAVKKVCVFVQEKFALNRRDTMRLYDLVFEMMLNTKEHAYEGSAADTNWYMFAKFDPDRHIIDFCFLDTGMGIAKTINKTKLEIASRWLEKYGLNITDINLLKSAFSGAYKRTRTLRGYRGKGLPKIRKYAKSGVIKNVCIVSNRGLLRLTRAVPLRNEFMGTLYTWTVSSESFSC